jgi:hypothetical protein
VTAIRKIHGAGRASGVDRKKLYWASET